MSEGAPVLRRALGLPSAVCVVVGAIVGVGIFFTPSKVVTLAGSGGLALVAWGIGGLIAMAGALTFGALGRRHDQSAGQYTVLKEAWHPIVGFLFVFCNATAVLAGAAAIISLICAKHVAVAVTGSDPSGTTTVVMALGLLSGVALANIAGVKKGALIQNCTVVAKLATLLAVAGLALVHQDTASGQEVFGALDSATAPSSSWISALLAALVPVLFSFGGWQQALWIGGEVKNPLRVVPLAIVIGVSIVISVYLIANWAYLWLLGPAQVANSQALAADATAVVWPHQGERIVAGAVAISAFGVLNAQLMSGPRLLFGLAKDGRWFASFAEVHRRFRTPVASILLLAALSSGLILAAGSDGVDKILTGVVLVDTLFFLATGVAAYRLARRQVIQLSPWVPLLFTMGEGVVLIGAFQDEATRNATWIGLTWVVLGTVLYLLRFRTADRA